MLYQQVVFVLLTVVLLNLLANLRSLKLPKSNIHLPDPAPLISVLVPARNEEANIGVCLESLCKQDYPNYEILVLDDSSTDSTADIVAKIAVADSRVRLMHGQPLPPGWAGKTFACHQLAREARGSWLLFTDADTVHAPSMLSKILGVALVSHAALISGFPYQRTASIWQKMVMPLMFYFLILCGMPLWFIQRSHRNMPALAIGQFLFFSANEYRSIGGHEAVKSSIMEDVYLGREVSRHHYRQLTLDLSSLVYCQMYRGNRTMWDGIARWLYVVASMSVFSVVGLVAVVLVLFLAPFVWLAYGLVLAQPAFGWEVLVVLQVAIVFLARFLAGSRFSQPKTSILLHPVGMLLLVMVALYACFQYVTGGRVRWKGRLYGSETKTA